LSRILGTKREDVVEGWRKMHNELHNLYASPNIIIIKSRKMIWGGHVACMGEMGSAYRLWSQNLMAKDHFKGLGVK